ncbi:hypothetical protein SAMN05444000_11520 [Shimia gijangensis]|uniref:Uncharacterized protein n=1 Tax=Shimia gijangensis TaxID=1470563 RepID=A0A1M6N301_9RHOB|nr:hypothetical protein SAMN05444000_11520 [Shimia gijangensis]
MILLRMVSVGGMNDSAPGRSAIAALKCVWHKTVAQLSFSDETTESVQMGLRHSIGLVLEAT